MQPCAASAQPLRQGFSTGACAAACITAAWNSLTHLSLAPEASETPLCRELLFPDGKSRILHLNEVKPGFASIIKDGGDDPDCTHGAELYCRVRQAQPNEGGAQDYMIPVGSGLLILRAVEGIGLCTRPGLDCKQGHWAINTGPRGMITENLAALSFSGCFLAEIGVRNGEEIAKKTLNAQLGVIGGISILGTTGIVRPFSHDAYIQTIRICIRSSKLLGLDEVVLCTGGRTQSAARKHLPSIPETGFICIGDFIGESLKTAAEQQMKRVTIACMPGKLCKYAAGFENTHAHKVNQDIPLFLETLLEFHSPTEEEKREISRCASVRQALEHVPAPLHTALYASLCHRVFHQFSIKSPHTGFRILLYNFDGTLLLEARSTDNPTPCHH